MISSRCRTWSGMCWTSLDPPVAAPVELGARSKRGIAHRFGFASILGSFAAGLLVRMIDLSGRAPHPQFQTKLEGISFGFLIPFFFIATGVEFDLKRSPREPRRDHVPLEY